MPSRAALRAVTELAALTAVGGVAYAAARSRPLAPDAPPPMPPSGLPAARLVRVPGVGEMFVRDTAPPASTGPTDTGRRDDDDRPVVVLLHGWMFPSDLNWFTAYDALGTDARVLAVDHRGHGRGTRPSRPFRLCDVADDVAALLRELRTGPVVAVGYSMGGPVAQLLAQRHPDLVAGVVYCATSAAFTVRAADRWQWRLMGALQVALRLLPRHTLEGALARQVAGSRVQLTRMLHRDTPDDVVALLPWFVSELDRGSPEDVAEAGRELGRYDARGWVGSLDVPAAVLVTTRDRLVPLANQRDLADRVPGAWVVELPLAHDAAVGGAATFVPALRDAVAAVRDAAAMRSTGAPNSGAA